MDAGVKRCNINRIAEMQASSAAKTTDRRPRWRLHRKSRDRPSCPPTRPKKHPAPPQMRGGRSNRQSLPPPRARSSQRLIPCPFSIRAPQLLFAARTSAALVDATRLCPPEKDLMKLGLERERRRSHLVFRCLCLLLFYFMFYV